MVKMSYTEEYNALSTLLDIVMSERTKKQFDEFKAGWNDSDKELIDVALKAGWIAATLDCGYESLQDFYEKREKKGSQ